MIQKPLAATYTLLTVILFLHLCVAGQLGLTVDGAHYALYAKHLAWSYFDHPPMVGWLQAPIIHLSHSNFALRIVPMLLSFLWPLALYRLVRHLFPTHTPWLAFYTVLVSQCVTIFFVLGFAYTPQVPLLLCYLLALNFLWDSFQGTSRHWFYTGIFFGLSALCDYTAIFLLITALSYTGIKHRHLLLTKGPWIAAVTALIIAAPVFYWNIQHHWISILYQLHHGTQGTHWRWSRFGVSQLFQFAAYTPFLYITAYCIFFKHLFSKKEAPVLFLYCWIVPILLLYAITSGWEKILPHWPALAWVGLSILTTYTLYPLKKRILKYLAIIALGYSALMILLLTSICCYQFLPLPYLKNPLRDLYGWRQAAHIATHLLQNIHPINNTPPVLMVNNWTLASRISWYSGQAVFVTDNNPHVTQFSLWHGHATHKTYGVLILPAGWHLNNRPHTPGNFSQCHRLKTLTIHRYNKRVNQFIFYACYDFTPPH